MKIIELDLIKSMSLSGGWIRSKEVKRSKEKRNCDYAAMLKAAEKSLIKQGYFYAPYVPLQSVTFSNNEPTYVNISTTTTSITTPITTYSTTINGYYA